MCVCVRVCVHIDVVRFTLLVTVERLKQITSSPTAWVPAYATLEAADDTRVPECTEGFMQIIAGITGEGRGITGEGRGITSEGHSIIGEGRGITGEKSGVWRLWTSRMAHVNPPSLSLTH